MRRYASHYLRLPGGECLKMQVVEVSAGRYVRHFPLAEEAEDIVWIPGTLAVDGQGRVVAEDSSTNRTRLLS